MAGQIMDLGWWLALAAVVAIVGVGRVVRLVTYDDFPPSVWVRQVWTKLTRAGSWTKLAFCLWCLAPWVMALCIGWFLLSLTIEWAAWSWWLFWGWMALSYVSSIFTYWDEGGSGE